MKSLSKLILIVCIVSCNSKEQLKVSKACGYTTSDDVKIKNVSKADMRELQAIKQICNYSGLRMNFNLYKADVAYAIASLEGENRNIYYNKELFRNFSGKEDDYWYSIAILAHEVGHHLNMHFIGNDKTSQEMELEADKFSGFILEKMGATKEQSLYAIETLRNVLDTQTHPSYKRRTEAILLGWQQAKILKANFYSLPISIPQRDTLEISGKEYFYGRLLNEKDFCWYDQEDPDNSRIKNVEDFREGFCEGIVIDKTGSNIDNTESTQIFIYYANNLADKEMQNTRIWASLIEPNNLCLCRPCISGLFMTLTQGNIVRFKFKKLKETNAIVYITILE